MVVFYLVEDIYPTAVYTRLMSLITHLIVVYVSSGISLAYPIAVYARPISLLEYPMAVHPRFISLLAYPAAVYVHY